MTTVTCSFAQRPGDLDPSGRTFDEHLDACPECRRRFAQRVRERRSFDLSASAPRGALEELPAGTRLGRYVLLELVVAGAMGVVYAAYDPELDRKIGIKLLRSGTTAAAEAKERLLQEAHSLARLTHPNVVHLYDVGHFGEQLFLAMELVAGGSLAAWLEAAPRKWAEVVRVFLQAGRGLKAAHDAGLVHRDFKPENVLVGGDGAVRVTDFGLAAPVAKSAAGVVGTPRYMAPEVLAGGAADARSDQFAFCVALHEALFGRPPFDGDSLEALRATAEQPHKPPPPGRRAPRRVLRVLRRGLQRRPEDRFADLGALLEELSFALRARRRLGWAALAAAALGGAALGAVGFGWSRTAACAGLEGQLTGVWDPSGREAVQRAFAATGKPFAPYASRHVVEALDRFAAEWVQTRTELCQARRRGDVAEPHRQLALACLERRRRELRVISRYLQQADGALVERAAMVVDRLPPPPDCQDPGRTGPLLELTEEAKAAEPGLHASLAELQAEIVAARFRPALDRADRCLAEARRVGHRGLQAEAQLMRGLVLERLERWREARQELGEALVQASANGQDLVAARAWIARVRIEGEALGDDQGALWSAAMASALLSRLGEDAALSSRLHDNLGRLWLARGKDEAALEEFSSALAIAKRGRIFEPDVAAETGNMAIALHHLGRFTESVEKLEETLALLERSFGQEHPRVITAMSNLGLALAGVGRAEEGLQKVLLAQRLRQPLGKEHLSAAYSQISICSVRALLGQHREALGSCEEALKVAEGRYGSDNPLLYEFLNETGAVRTAALDPKGGLALHRRALALRERTKSGSQSWGHLGAGRALLALGRPQEALEELDRAFAQLNPAGAEPNLVARIRLGRARALAALGRLAEGRAQALAAREELQALVDAGKLVRAPELDEAERLLSLWRAPSRGRAPKGGRLRLGCARHAR